MVDRKHDPRDRNIWKSPGGALFFKLGIPPNLRSKFLSSTGKPKTKISEPLGTDSLTEARVFRDQKLAHYQRVFARMNAGVDLLPEEIKAEVTKYRAQVPMPELAALLIKPTSSGDPSKPDVDSMIEQQVGPALDEVGKRLGFERHSEQWYALGIALVKSNWAALGKQVIAAAVGEQPAPTPVEQPPAVANRNRNSNGNLERFSIALGHYLDWMRDVRKARIATIADYKSKAQRFQKFANDPSLGAVTIEQAKAFLNEVEAEGPCRLQSRVRARPERTSHVLRR
jgi:hypothetical protein